MMKTLIKNSKIIGENKILIGHSLVIEDGKISKIIKNDVSEQADKVVDGKGCYLSPGFIDIHNHGNNGFDTMDSTIEAIDGMAKFHIKNGVTSFLATTMTASFVKTKKAISNVVDYIEKEEQTAGKAKCLGLYLEGPFFSTEKCGAQPKEYIKNPDMGELRAYLQIGKGLVRIVALAPELDGSIEATQYLVSNGVVVSCGHSNAKYTETMNVFTNGARQVTHMYNGMRAFSHREPGIIGAALVDKRVSCEMICDGIHLHNGAMRLVYEAKGKDHILLISDAMRATGLVDGTYDLGGQMVDVRGNEARLSDGALAGSTLTMNRAVKNMIKLVDIPVLEAVQMATINPARQLGMDKIAGSIEVGKNADLVIFDDDINIQTVFINGVEI
jgi:N-acetylglucosamine-6-phosphate deacetylase